MREDRAALMIGGTAMLWGSVGVVVREVDLPAVAVVSGRILLAAPALAVFVLLVRPGAAWGTPTPRLALNGLVLAAHWVCFIAALQRAPIGTVLLITYLAPVGIAALAPAFLGEVVPVRTKVALAVAIAGIVLIAVPAMDGTSADGVVLAILTGVLYVPLALLNKALSDEFGGLQLAMWQLVIAGAALLPFAAAADWGTSGSSYSWLLVLAVVYTAFAFGTYLSALAYVPATRAAVILYIEPASAVVFGWLLLDESPTLLTIVGGVLVLGAGLAVARVPVAPEVPPVTSEVTDVPG